MLIQGGYTTENKTTLGDFNLFDMEAKKWIECSYNDEMSPRQMHTMQAVYDQNIYDRFYMMQNNFSKQRAMWVNSKQMVYKFSAEGPLAKLF